MSRVVIRESVEGRFHLAQFGVSIGGEDRLRPFVILVQDRNGNVLLRSQPTTADSLGIAARGRGDYDKDGFHAHDVLSRDSATGQLVASSALGRRIPWVVQQKP